MDPLEIARLNSATGFGQLVGLAFDRASRDEVVGHVDIGPQHLQPYGQVNGGMWSTVVETFGSIGGMINVVDDGRYVVGIANATDFLRPVSDGRVDVVATPLHVGRQQHLWQVIITREDGKVAARGQVRLQVLDQ